jgi:hypothetical protein
VSERNDRRVAIEAGPTPEELAEVHRLRLEQTRLAPMPTPLELQTNALGARFLELAIRTGVTNNDSKAVRGRVFPIDAPLRRSTDALEERIAAARIKTRSGEVIATGGELKIGKKRVAPETLQQFKEDLPELALELSRQATLNFIADFTPPKGKLRRVMVSARRVVQTMIENHQSRILAVASLVFAMATPAAVVLGASLAVQVGAAGVAMAFLCGGAGASAKDRARRRAAAVVRRQLDPQAREIAIHELEAWGRGMIRARELIEQPTRARDRPTPFSVPRVARPAVANVNLVA